jgi:hypothetical protein
MANVQGAHLARRRGCEPTEICRRAVSLSGVPRLAQTTNFVGILCGAQGRNRTTDTVIFSHCHRVSASPWTSIILLKAGRARSV